MLPSAKRSLQDRWAGYKHSKGQREIIYWKETSGWGLSKTENIIKHTKNFCWEFMFMQWLRNALPAFMVKSWCLLDLLAFCYPRNKHLSAGNWLWWSLFGSSESFRNPQHIASSCSHICIGATVCTHSTPLHHQLKLFPQGFLRLGACSCSRDRTLPLLMVALHVRHRWASRAHGVPQQYTQNFCSITASTSPVQPSLPKTPL